MDRIREPMQYDWNIWVTYVIDLDEVRHASNHTSGQLDVIKFKVCLQIGKQLQSLKPVLPRSNSSYLNNETTYPDWKKIKVSMHEFLVAVGGRGASSKSRLTWIRKESAKKWNECWELLC